MKLSTLCYIKDRGRTLMLHRIKKKSDMHKGKWNGFGGKFEKGESPEECVLREVKEECGLDIISPELKGTLTFPSFSKEEDWYVFVFVATRFTGELINCAEGEIHWIDDKSILDLDLWEGDRIFLPLLERKDFFSGKFVYSDGKLLEHKITIYNRSSS